MEAYFSPWTERLKEKNIYNLKFDDVYLTYMEK